MPRQTTSTKPQATRGSDLPDLLQGWSDRGHGSLANRLAASLRGLVGAGLLTQGAKLPAERALATALAVSRSTVTAALDELRADGTLESRQGSGTVVAAFGAPPALTGTRVATHFTAVHHGIDLATGNPPDASHLPPLQLDVMDLVTDGEGPGTQPLGLPALRAALAERHSAQGLVTQAEQIHVTSGAHHATSLALRAVVPPGAPVAVEETSYPGIFDVIDAIGGVAIPLARDRAGVLPESLDHALRRGATAVYHQSGPHNPTGRVTPASRLRALAEVLDRHRATVVDDVALDDLTFDRSPRPRLAELCRSATVVTIGSVSKVAWGGFRIGWMRASATFVEQTMHLRLGFDLGASVPAQLIVLRLLPHLDDVGAARRATLQTSVERAIELFAVELPSWEIDPPQGGSVLWPRTDLPDTGPLVQLAARHGVRVAPGSIACCGREADPHLRVCVDRPWPHVEEGIRRIRSAWDELHAGTPTTPVLG